MTEIEYKVGDRVKVSYKGRVSVGTITKIENFDGMPYFVENIKGFHFRGLWFAKDEHVVPNNAYYLVGLADDNKPKESKDVKESSDKKSWFQKLLEIFLPFKYDKTRAELIDEIKDILDYNQQQSLTIIKFAGIISQRNQEIQDLKDRIKELELKLSKGNK